MNIKAGAGKAQVPLPALAETPRYLFVASGAAARLAKPRARRSIFLMNGETPGAIP